MRSFLDGGHQSSIFLPGLASSLILSALKPKNMQTALVTITTSAGGLAKFLSTAISLFWIQLTASSAAFNAGIAAAN